MGFAENLHKMVDKNVPSRGPVRSCFKAHFYSSHNIKQQTIILEIVKGSARVCISKTQKRNKNIKPQNLCATDIEVSRISQSLALAVQKKLKMFPTR